MRDCSCVDLLFQRGDIGGGLGGSQAGREQGEERRPECKEVSKIEASVGVG